MRFEKDSKELKQTYVELLIEYGKKDQRICIVEADLMRSAGTMPFSQEIGRASCRERVLSHV